MSSDALHNLLLSLHLIGVFLLLIGITIEVVTLLAIRKVQTVETLRQALFAGRAVEKIMPISTFIIMAAGIWLAFLGGDEYRWDSAWIITAFFTVIFFALNGSLFIGKRMERIGREAFKSPEGPIPTKLVKLCNEQRLHDMTWIGIGVVFSFIVLMVDKPNWAGSILTVIVGALVGFLISRRLGRPKTI